LLYAAAVRLRRKIFADHARELREEREHTGTDPQL
jgi:hypothetical protein